MSYNDRGNRLCAGCGRPDCGCTPDDVRRQLESDRAELSNRAAVFAPRANEAARLLRLARPHIDVQAQSDVDWWIAGKEPR